MKTVKFVFMLLLTGCLLQVIPAYCQEEVRGAAVPVRGFVVSVDLQKSALVVNLEDSTENFTVRVPAGAKIVFDRKAHSQIPQDISAIQPGDFLIIEMAKDSNVAVRIFWDKKQ